MSVPKTMVHLHNGMLLSREKEEAYTLCNSMDGTREHYAKWNKPGSERQIPYDLTYKWNLINKGNKQAKYNQKHWNKEQTDSNQRGRGRRGWEGKGGRVAKNMSKGYMDKTKGGTDGGWVGQGKVVVGKWRQLYLNNDKKWLKKNNIFFKKLKLILKNKPFSLL